MAALLAGLTKVALVDIISGRGLAAVSRSRSSAACPRDTVRENFIIQPTTGTKLYRYANGAWTSVYAELFNAEESKQIRDALKAAVEEAGYAHEQTWGEQIEDRGSQVTFSALGQQAPLEAKDKWDPDHAKRRKLQGPVAGHAARSVDQHGRIDLDRHHPQGRRQGLWTEEAGRDGRHCAR